MKRKAAKCKIVAPIAEVCESDGHGDVDGGEQPEENDGEQAADGEDNQSGAAGRLWLETSRTWRTLIMMRSPVNNCPDKEEEAEKREDSEQSHGDRPPQPLQLGHPG